jgi:hypothetical protein
MGRECAKYVAAWRGLSPEQRVVQKIKKEEKRLQKIQDREARHQRALIRAKEDNRRRALAAYHAGAKLRQVSGGFYWESKKKPEGEVYLLPLGEFFFQGGNPPRN